MQGNPRLLARDNGREFTCKAFDHRTWARGISPQLIDPGRPMQNAYVVPFAGRFRDECM